MHYVYLTRNVVTDQAQVDPYKIFSPPYAAQFIKAPDEVTFDWSFIDGEWVAPLHADDIAAQVNKNKALQLLQQTDWTATIDIADPQYSNPHLTNQSDFLTYRSLVRQIAINPPTSPAVFPTLPVEQWS